MILNSYRIWFVQEKWCVYCTKLEPISKTNDVARGARGYKGDVRAVNDVFCGSLKLCAFDRVQW